MRFNWGEQNEYIYHNVYDLQRFLEPISPKFLNNFCHKFTEGRYFNRSKSVKNHTIRRTYPFFSFSFGFHNKKKRKKNRFAISYLWFVSPKSRRSTWALWRKTCHHRRQWEIFLRPEGRTRKHRLWWKPSRGWRPESERASTTFDRSCRSGMAQLATRRPHPMGKSRRSRRSRICRTCALLSKVQRMARSIRYRNPVKIHPCTLRNLFQIMMIWDDTDREFIYVWWNVWMYIHSNIVCTCKRKVWRTRESLDDWTLMIKEKKEKKNSAKNSTKKIYRRICNLRVPKLKFSTTIRGNRQRYIAKIFFFFSLPW